jgi:hypothetical protein
MLQLDPDKHWHIWLFIGSFVLVVGFALGTGILGLIVLYGVVEGFSAPHHRPRRCG